MSEENNTKAHRKAERLNSGHCRLKPCCVLVLYFMSCVAKQNGNKNIGKSKWCVCANRTQVHPKNPSSNKSTDHKIQPWRWKRTPGNKWIDKSDITNTGTHRAVARSSQWCYPSMPSGQQKDLRVEWRGALWVSGQSKTLVCRGGRVCLVIRSNRFAFIGLDQLQGISSLCLLMIRSCLKVSFVSSRYLMVACVCVSVHVWFIRTVGGQVQWALQRPLCLCLYDSCFCPVSTHTACFAIILHLCLSLIYRL